MRRIATLSGVLLSFTILNASPAHAWWIWFNNIRKVEIYEQAAVHQQGTANEVRVPAGAIGVMAESVELENPQGGASTFGPQRALVFILPKEEGKYSENCQKSALIAQSSTTKKFAVNYGPPVTIQGPNIIGAGNSNGTIIYVPATSAGICALCTGDCDK